MSRIKIEEHRIFKKYYQKLSVKQQIIYHDRILLLQKNIKHPLLKLHPLRGTLNGFYAFSLSGDLRVIFQWISDNHIVLYKIGTHNQIY
jgi:mRNA-degrading endonuclease YafQ of YafQ-DinJ toxin-antitoxin module